MTWREYRMREEYKSGVRKGFDVKPNKKRSQGGQDMVRQLRKSHPEFFADDDTRKLVAIIVLEMGDTLAQHPVVERIGMIANIVALMYQMAKAAIVGIHDPEERSIAQIFIADYRKKQS